MKIPAPAAPVRWLGTAMVLFLFLAFALSATADDGAGQKSPFAELTGFETTTEDLAKELIAVAIRLPLAAALGSMLALRPRRRGTPIRRPAVVQTQIVLAIVGAVIMLVVGASLARAFGIVGVAGLVRYRSKIRDPKDAVVMLSALAVGLAAGAGLFALAIFSTLFLVAALWVIEGFERQTRVFELSVNLGPETAGLRPRIEAVLRRIRARYELRSASEEGASYLVTLPLEVRTDTASQELIALVPNGQGKVKWDEKADRKGK